MEHALLFIVLCYILFQQSNVHEFLGKQYKSQMNQNCQRAWSPLEGKSISVDF